MTRFLKTASGNLQPVRIGPNLLFLDEIDPVLDLVRG
jgi:hypothetical protein